MFPNKLPFYWKLPMRRAQNNSRLTAEEFTQHLFLRKKNNRFRDEHTNPGFPAPCLQLHLNLGTLGGTRTPPQSPGASNPDGLRHKFQHNFIEFITTPMWWQPWHFLLFIWEFSAASWQRQFLAGVIKLKKYHPATSTALSRSVGASHSSFLLEHCTGKTRELQNILLFLYHF